MKVKCSRAPGECSTISADKALPKGWSSEQLGPHVDIRSGESPSLFSFQSRGIPYFKVEQLNGANKYLSETPYFTNVERPVAAGSIIFPKRGASILLNKIRLLQTPGYMDTNLMSLTPREAIYGEYLFYWLGHKGLAQFADVTSIPQINNKHIAPLLVQFPEDKEEQRRIAAALADSDALIESLEQLLTKKRQIKQGAMQELLTGKRRLRQEDIWHTLRLGDTATLKARIGWQGLTTAEYRERGEHLLVTGTEFMAGRIRWDACHYVDQDRYEQDKNIQLAVNDVLVTKDGTIGKVALVDSLPIPATLNSGVFVVRPRNKAFHPGFFSCILASPLFTSFLGQLSAGSTINHLYQKDFVHFTFDAPRDLQEQQEIYEVISEIDSDIAALESRLTKASALKQAMAQALLTGRIRLVEPTA